ncbi:GntR family transcriptional regulator [Micromonospora zingiberis]|uniref:GntR family transcriptional regulator n=1 Tax=Micromonospora zingiberis TaxID=2053011 RepID=A0A4R0GL18_9ACTN|nr:GntR family transcriptional regulator [Micromonospora zingiberis]TCB98324.1 GntR family transcriptional regulator [Micromonospora zingiberis]
MSTPPSGPDPTAGPQSSVASQRIAAELREAILAGQIPPGTRLYQEEIAERLGASRLPVREALRILEAEGLTESQANRGARVPLRTMREVEVLYRMRERLEPLALHESLADLPDSTVDRLTEIQEQIEANDDVTGFVTLDREFHLLTYSACPIDTLLATVVTLWNSTQYYRRAFMLYRGQGERWIINAEHRLLLDAIRRRDRIDTERYLAGHIRRTRQELVRHPELFAPSAP